MMKPAIQPTTREYAKEVGIGLAAIGALIAIYDFAEIVAKPLFGVLADRVGMKRTMLAGIALFVIASLLYPFVDPRLLIGIRFLQGIGAAALSAVSLAMVGLYFTENRGRAYGIYNAIKGSGYVLSPVVGGAIVVQSNFAAIFYATAAVGVVAFLISMTLPSPPSEKVNLDDDANFSLKSLAAVFRQSDLLPWYFVTVVNMFFVGILFGFLPVHIANLGYSPLHSGLLIAVVALAYLLVQPVAGRLAEVFRPASTIKAGLVLAAFTVMATPFTQGVSLIVLSIAAGVGVGVVWTNTDLLFSQSAKEGRLGATMGMAGSFKEFGDMVGPLLIGSLSQVFGLTIGFVACGILGLAALLLAFFLGRYQVDSAETGQPRG
jgi:DHA1 family tetracycline resistance protein-like MFS transporter